VNPVSEDGESTVVRVELREAEGERVDELVVGFRRGEDLHELASLAPPAAVELRRLPAPEDH
jgi:hypothetical protein